MVIFVTKIALMKTRDYYFPVSEIRKEGLQEEYMLSRDE